MEDLDGWVFVEWSRANSEELVKGVNFPPICCTPKCCLRLELYMKFLVLRRRQEKLKETIEIDRLEETILQTMNTEYRKGWKNTGECTEVCQYYAFFRDCSTDGR